MNIDALRILDRIDQYVFLKDPQGIYRYVNEPLARIASVTPAEMVGKTDRELSWRVDAERWAETDAQVLAGKSIIRAEETYHCLDGEFKFLVTKIPYRTDDGEIVGILGNFFDCSGRLILETSGTFDEDKHRLHLEFVPDWLSASEVRVCFYLIQGFPVQRIAEKIGIAVGTVRFHIENIKTKMQCASKSDIVEVAMRTGIAWKIFSLQHVDDFNFNNGR